MAHTVYVGTLVQLIPNSRITKVLEVDTLVYVGTAGTQLKNPAGMSSRYSGALRYRRYPTQLTQESG